MCRGCRVRGLFFESGKEFSIVLCSLFIIGWEWMLEQVVAWGKSETVPVKGVEDSRSLFPSPFVGRCIRAGFLKQ